MIQIIIELRYISPENNTHNYNRISNQIKYKYKNVPNGKKVQNLDPKQIKGRAFDACARFGHAEDHHPPENDYFGKLFTAETIVLFSDIHTDKQRTIFERTDVEFSKRRQKEVDDFDTHTHTRARGRKDYEMNEYKKKKTMENGLLQFRPLYNTFSSAILKAAEIFVRIKAVFVSRGSFFFDFSVVCVCRYLFFPIFFSRAKIFNNGGRFEIFIRNWHRMWFRLIIRYYRALFRS